MIEKAKVIEMLERLPIALPEDVTKREADIASDAKHSLIRFLQANW